MTLVSEIITDSYRESNLIPVNQTPIPAEQVEGLRRLNRFIKSVYGSEAGENLQPAFVGKANITTPDQVIFQSTNSTSFVPLNSRVVANLEEATILNLHPMPNDGSRLMVVDVAGTLATNPLTFRGNGHKIDGALTTTLSVDSLQKEWMYRADLGQWVTISSLELADTFPFPEEFDDFFVIGLATRLNPRNGVATDEQTLSHFRRQRNLFRARYKQTVEHPPEAGIVRLTGVQWNTLPFEVN